MENQRSYFGVNIIVLFALNIVLAIVASSGSNTFAEFAGIVGFLLGITLALGLLYGFFRLFGARVEAIEDFYQLFPLGYFLNRPHEAGDEELSGEQSGSPALKHEQKPGKEAWNETHKRAKSFDWNTIEWNKIFSYQYLRYAGILLIVTAIFSLLFNIHWELIHKIIACFAAGVVFFGCAELLRRKGKAVFASASSLISFTFLQFGLTLLYTYFLPSSQNELLGDPHFWLGAKLLLTYVFIFSLSRYPSDFQETAFVLIAYATPFTLLHSGAVIELIEGSVYLLLLTVLLLALGRRREELWTANAAIANAYAYLFYLSHSSETVWTFSAPQFALCFAAVLFLSHLCVSTFFAAKRTEQVSVKYYLHLVVIHVAAAMGILVLSQDYILLKKYIGIAYLILALAPFASYISLYSKKVQAPYTEVMLNLSILISSLGLFLQVEGSWSAIIFLVYACAILFYSLYNAHIRTRIYGFIILTIALVKLYLEFSDIFDSIPGTLAVLVIGMVLIGISYKFEALKDLVLEGFPRKKELT